MDPGTVIIKIGKAILKRDTEVFGSMSPYVVVNCGMNHEFRTEVHHSGGKKPDFRN